MCKTVNKSKKIRKGDKVVAIAGNCRGQVGTVLRCLGERLVVQGLNVRKKHVKKTQGGPGKILDIECPIHISNLRVCLDDGKALNLKVRTNENGVRELYYKLDDQEIVYRALKNS